MQKYFNEYSPLVLIIWATERWHLRDEFTKPIVSVSLYSRLPAIVSVSLYSRLPAIVSVSLYSRLPASFFASADY